MKCDKHIVNQKQTVSCCKIIKALKSEIGTQKQTKNINPQVFYKNLSLYGLDGNTFICCVCACDPDTTCLPKTKHILC